MAAVLNVKLADLLILHRVNFAWLIFVYDFVLSFCFPSHEEKYISKSRRRKRILLYLNKS